MRHILIADDHNIVAEGIRNILQSHFDADVSIVNTLAQCDTSLQERHVDLLLLDIGMPDGNALDSLPQWKSRFPNTKVVILSCYAEAAVIVRAKSAGANGYVLKDSSSDQLLSVINRTCSSDSTTFNMCQRAEDALSGGDDEQAILLTPREREVLALIVSGLPIKQVADKLGLSFETVHSYTKILRAKLQVNNSAALVRKAIEQKLV